MTGERARYVRIDAVDDFSAAADAYQAARAAYAAAVEAYHAAIDAAAKETE